MTVQPQHHQTKQLPFALAEQCSDVTQSVYKSEALPSLLICMGLHVQSQLISG